MRPRPVTALTLAAAAALAACGETPSPAPAPGAPAPAAANAPAPVPELPPGPPEATVDDEAVLAQVFESARTGAPLPPSLAKLPPRVSPMRVAVRAIHDHLLGLRAVPPSWEQLLGALDQLASGDRTTVDAGALAKALPAWRAWSAADREAEHALAVRYTRGLDVLRAQGPLDAPALAVAASRSVPAPPAKSPAFASVAALQALHAVLTTPGDEVPAEVAGPLTAARRAFDDLGWPAGLAPFLEIGAVRLSWGGRTTMREHALLDHAFAAYRDSKDELRVALVTYDRVAGAERQGDVARALKLARTAAEQVRATGTRGREMSDALFRLGQLALAAGRATDAAEALQSALDEIDHAKLDPAQRAPVQERRATALWIAGRCEEAWQAALDGAKAYDTYVRAATPEQERLRAQLDEVAGRAMADGGRAGDAVAQFLAAAARNEKLPGGDVAAMTDRLFAADALVKCGQREAAVATVRDVLARPGAGLLIHAHASSVLRDAGALEEAQRELSSVLAQSSPELREALLEEAARLEAARRAYPAARELFQLAARRAAKAAPGLPTARVLLDWARMERDAGDLEECARLADQAIGQLAETPFVVETDRARKLWLDAQRRRGYYRDAVRVAKERVAAGPPGDAAARLDAALDLALTLTDLVANDPSAHGALEAAVEAIPAGVERDALAAVALGRPWTRGASVEVSSKRGLALVHAVDRAGSSPASLLEFARALPADEPELRRWALRRVASGDPGTHRTVDWVAWIDLWRGVAPTTTEAVRAALGPDDRFVAAEPWGGGTVVVHVSAQESGATLVPGDLGLARWWDAVRVEPTPQRLRDSAAAVTSAEGGALGSALAAAPGRRIFVSLGPPVGPLPADLLPAGDGKLLLDVADVCVAQSPAEFVAAASRAAPPALSFARGAESPLELRHAVVALAPADDAARSRFSTLVDEARSRGLAPSAAVRDAKLRLREEWKPDPARPVVPPWAAFALRGAP